MTLFTCEIPSSTHVAITIPSTTHLEQWGFPAAHI